MPVCVCLCVCVCPCRVSIRDLSVYGFDMRNLKYAITLCDALTQLHELDLVHLDLKPGNLFYDGDKLCVSMGA